MITLVDLHNSACYVVTITGKPMYDDLPDFSNPRGLPGPNVSARLRSAS